MAGIKSFSQALALLVDAGHAEAAPPAERQADGVLRWQMYDGTWLTKAETIRRAVALLEEQKGQPA